MLIYVLEKNIPIRVDSLVCIVIHKEYMATTWSNSSHTIK